MKSGVIPTWPTPEPVDGAPDEAPAKAPPAAT